MADQAKNILIGLFVLAACAIILLILLFLHPSTGDMGKILNVRFANIDKVSVGTRVTFAGKAVGEVESIHELQEAIDSRSEINGFVYVYELKLKVDSSVNVYNSDKIALHTSGLLGERSVEITPSAPRPGQKLRLVNNEILYASETGSVEDTLKEFKELADKVEIVLDAVSATLSTVEKQHLWENLGTMGKNLAEITDALNRPEELTQTIANAHEFSRRALNAWDVIDRSLGEFSVASTNARVFTEEGVAIAQQIKSGKGTIGRLIEGDDLYLQTNALFSKGETILNDINHYGLLFHLDKGWQRMRARRLNLLNKLSSPQEFRNYFNDEIDKISTSLSRVAMVLDKTNEYPYNENLIENREFAKVYSELLRRVSILEENLRMYNQQLADTQAENWEVSYQP